MSSLPRIDEVENMLQKQWEEGTITKNLEKELINELKDLNLLDQLISSRIESLILETANLESLAEESGGKNEDTNHLDFVDRAAHEWFENQTDRYYLERIQSFEKVSFLMFRTLSKGIAMEAHQRLVEEEESWQQIIERWGLEPEKLNEGKYLKISADKINKTLYDSLKRLEKGEISEPIRTGKIITILKLLDWQKVELNQETREVLEKEMYANWLAEETNKIIKKIA